MRRDSEEIVNEIKNKYGVDNVYSYSQVKNFDDDPYEYLLKYILHIEPDVEQDNVYAVCGTIVHNILEKLYNKEIVKEDCKKIFQEEFKNAMLDDNTSKFSDDVSYNRTMADRFQLDITNFFDNLSLIDGEIKCEELVDILIKNEQHRAAFLGYVDFMSFKEDGTIQIIDYKTSSLYRKKDIPDYSKQLILYAEAVRRKYNKGYKDIKVGWNFLKYAIAIRKDDMSDELIERKFMSNYPKDLYMFKDCIILIDFNEKVVNEFINNMLNKVAIIEDMTATYNIDEDDTPFCYKVTSDKLFRLNNFCKYTEKYHKPLREFLSKND